MNSLRVIENEVFIEASTGFRDSQILVEVDLLIFDCPPETFDEDIVINPAPAIHTDADALSGENLRELPAGKLGTLIGIENLRLGNLQRLFQGFYAKIRIHCGRNIPSQDIAAIPVHDGNKIDKTLLQTNIRQINGPDLIRMIDNDISQQIRILLMLWMGFAQILLRINRLQTHLAHQPADPLVIYLMTLYLQTLRYPGNTVKGRLGKLFINKIHK